MQRLTRRRSARRDERGAVSVLVALLMVPILGFAALAVDVAALHAERVQLQNGADAAALAIAQDCALGACGVPAVTAQVMSVANQALKGALTAQPTVSVSAGQVSVTTRSTRQHVFGPVLGINSSPVSATAAVRWGSPTGGRAVLPITISFCEFIAQGGLLPTAGPRVIRLNGTAGSGCLGSLGLLAPGGFAWVTTDAGSCASTSALGQRIPAAAGSRKPDACNLTDLSAYHGKEVLLPIFRVAGGSGNNAWFQVYAYAAFRITGYHFGGPFFWNKPCSGNEQCLEGYFTRLVIDSGDFTYGPGAPDLGAQVVELVR